MRLPLLAIPCSILFASCSTLPSELGEEGAGVGLSGKRVVLVHGIFDTRITMIPLRKALENDGFQCFMPSLRPADGRGGLESMAQQLEAFIEEEFGPDETFSIVAFSMGGLVSRHYLQELGGVRRCRGFHTIATPHRGTYFAYLYPNAGTRQMRPRSAFLDELETAEGAFTTMPVTAYYNPYDNVILPAENSMWDQAENVSIKSAIHTGVLWKKALHEDLIDRLNREQSSEPG
ncbi:MAG: alpha/beta fold hydrolase [Verrucomicrobiota bacterium]